MHFVLEWGAFLLESTRECSRNKIIQSQLNENMRYVTAIIRDLEESQ